MILYASDYDEGLIVLSQHGEEIENQTGGVCCNHPSAKGFFVPLKVPPEIQNRLVDTLSLSVEDLVFCDEALKAAGYPWRSNSMGSEEAWLYVELGEGLTGILIWENSD